jgi:hypothetical protein
MGWMILGLLTTAPAMAEPPPSLDIRWDAPPGCPQETDVRDRLQRLLGSGRHSSQLRAEGTITRIDRRFRLDLVVRVRDLVGTRSIESNACEDLAGAAAVELGLLIHSTEAAINPSGADTRLRLCRPCEKQIHRVPVPTERTRIHRKGRTTPALQSERIAGRNPRARLRFQSRHRSRCRR